MKNKIELKARRVINWQGTWMRSMPNSIYYSSCSNDRLIVPNRWI